MNTTSIRTRLKESGIWQCETMLPVVGEVVIGTGRNEFQAQHQAAMFMDTNYPEIVVDWMGGYHGGDTSKRVGSMPSQYWGE